MLWSAIYLNQLPLEVFQRTIIDTPSPEARQTLGTPSRPILLGGLQIAVCDRFKVLMASTAAQALGIQAGIKRATALALAPDIVLIERKPEREQQAIAQVATWALQFTPSVTLENSGVILEIEPSLRLFGGLEKLISRIKQGLHELGFSAQMACAPTPLGAWLLAQSKDGAIAHESAQLNLHLAQLPIHFLPSALPHLAVLQTIGAHTIKDLVQLPRAGLTRRFGKTLLLDIDKALGKQPDPRDYFEAPVEFHSKLELMAQVENAQALLFAANRMLVELTGWLHARHCAVRSFALTAMHDERRAHSNEPTVWSIQLSDPTRDIVRLTGLLREKLNVLTLREPAHTLLLDCSDVHLLPSSTGLLFALPQTAQLSLSRLVERLQNRLGTHQVQQLELTQDYRPEAAYQLNTFVSEPKHVKEPEFNQAIGAFAHNLPRPLWLLSSALALEERNQRPYHQGPLQLLAGPERIEGGWWDRHFVQRDYFIAEDTHNNLYWIYRERAEHQSEKGPGWFMQGRFG